ncbi:MAG: hypothetical protein ACLQM8_12795 [Limisphaerales bacterium]
MSVSSVEVVLLCEDRQQEVFIRRFLQKRGRERPQFRAVVSPAARGSGEQWVREHFPQELKAHRSQRARRNNWLLVAIDADARTVAERIQQLAKACRDAGVPFREENEKVVFVVPKRNIETWFAYLRGETVNELDSYRRYDYEGDCRQEVDRLDEMCRRQRLEPVPPPPSLATACDEFRRIAQ